MFLLLAVTLRAQPPAITTDSKVEPKEAQITLAQSARVTLVIEGPAPLRVELPKELLTADSNAAWRIRPDPRDAKPEVKPVGKDRERWQLTYRLDPYADGKALVVSFNPVTVNGEKVTWKPIEITVTRTVGDPATTPPRPPTDPEDPPPPPIEHPQFPLGAAILLGFAGVAVLVAVLARKRKAKPVPAHERALVRLAKLEGKAGAEVVERVAAVLRAFVERRFAIPATKLTTAELAAAAREQGWPVEQAEPLWAILDECDRAKFAGDVPDDDGCRRLVRLAIDWVNHVSRPRPEPR